MPQPTDPYLQPALPEGTPSPPCPPGWVAEPIGRWDGRPQEVVYQPRRHDILIVRGAPSPKIEGTLPDTGWTHAHTTHSARLWVRARGALTRRDLHRPQHTPPTRPPHPPPPQPPNT